MMYKFSFRRREENLLLVPDVLRKTKEKKELNSQKMLKWSLNHVLMRNHVLIRNL